MPVTMPLSPGLSDIARRADLPVEIIEHFIEMGVINQPASNNDLAELRRIRRLHDLEVNLAGIEIILQMRRRLAGMQAEIETLTAQMVTLQTRFEKELQAVEQRQAGDPGRGSR